MLPHKNASAFWCFLIITGRLEFGKYVGRLIYKSIYTISFEKSTLYMAADAKNFTVKGADINTPAVIFASYIWQDISVYDNIIIAGAL